MTQRYLSDLRVFQKKHPKAEIPKKRSKKNPLTDSDKKHNQHILSSRVTVENIIRSIKIFRILAENTATEEKDSL